MKKMICLWIRMGKKNIKKSFFFLRFLCFKNGIPTYFFFEWNFLMFYEEFMFFNENYLISHDFWKCSDFFESERVKKNIKWSKKLMMFYENVMISYEFWGFVLRFFVILADVFIIF